MQTIPQTVPQIVPISDMAQRQGEVMPLLANGPVILAQRSKPAAVLTSVSQWDTIIKRVQELEQRELDRQFAAMKAGDYVDYADIEDEMDALDHANAS